MIIGRQYRLYPTLEQSETLSEWIGCVRSVLREKHKEASYLFWLKRWSIFSPSFEKPEESIPIINQACAHLKKDSAKPWLKDTPCDLYTPAMQAFKQSWDRFWKNPKQFGRPSAPKYDTYNSVTLIGQTAATRTQKIGTAHSSTANAAAPPNTPMLTHRKLSKIEESNSSTHFNPRKPRVAKSPLRRGIKKPPPQCHRHRWGMFTPSLTSEA